MAGTIQTDHPLVRRHGLLLLSQLLLQDFIKWRGLLIFRFIAATVDDDGEVATLAQYLLTQPLLTKQPTLLTASFVDAMFVFNGHKDHPKYSAAMSGGGAGVMDAVLSLPQLEPFSPEQTKNPSQTPNDKTAQRRLDVYRFMLGTMSDEQKIDVTAKVAHDVLSAVVTGSLDVDVGSHGECVVRDALAVLALPDIKVSGGRNGSKGADGDADAELEMAMDTGDARAAAAAGMAAAKGRLLTKMSRRQLLDHVIPICVALKQRFEALHSPLMRDLMAYLKELTRNYRSEVGPLFFPSFLSLLLALSFVPLPTSSSLSRLPQFVHMLT